MKLIVVGMAVLIGLGLIVYAFSPEAPITNYPSAGTDIIAFGDSLVAGVGATPGAGLVAQLEEYTGQPIINLGVSGNTTADGVKRLDELGN